MNLTEKFPADWKKANVYPKFGNPDLIKNHRHSPDLLTIIKLFETIVHLTSIFKFSNLFTIVNLAPVVATVLKISILHKFADDWKLVVKDDNMVGNTYVY